MAETLLRIGIITSTHGIKGEVKIFPTTDNPERFKKVKEVNISDNGKDTVLEVESAKVFEKSEVKIWKCRNCGHIVVGNKAPDICPVCAHPKSFFEIHEANY